MKINVFRNGWGTGGFMNFKFKSKANLDRPIIYSNFVSEVYTYKIKCAYTLSLLMQIFQP